MQTVYLTGAPVSVASFAYQSDKPTYYTEALSFYCLQLLENLSSSGAAIHVENSTPSEQGSAAVNWLASFKTWLSDCEESISAWLLESEESRVLPVLGTAPAWPVIIGEGAVVLYKGVIIKAAIDGFGALVRVSQQAVANRRQNELVRLLDRAFLRGSWFSPVKESRIDDLRVCLATLNDSIGNLTNRFTLEDKAGSYQGFAQAVYDILTAYGVNDDGSLNEDIETLVTIMQKYAKNDRVIKLLSHIILTHGGDIEETEFILAGEED